MSIIINKFNLSTMELKTNLSSNFLVQIQERNKQSEPKTVVVACYRLQTFLSEVFEADREKVVLISPVNTYEPVDDDPQFV